MKRLIPAFVYIVPALIAAAVFALCWYFQTHLGVDVSTFFADKLRGSLFAGFLTLGSFLLSLKTGIVIKIKEGLYDKPEYKTRLIQRRQLNTSLTHYGPLRRLSRLLSLAVFSALCAAAIQLTVGLVPFWWASGICLASATFSMGLLMASFFLIQANLSDWFNLLEDSSAESSVKQD
ncbi:MAG: hypothetical protein ACYCZJ_06840 [Sulfuriferula sp.]